LKNRYLFFPSNGTLQIMNVIRNDSGNYTMETFNSDGKSLKTHTLQLIAIAPVSSAQLVPECLSQGQMKVSCLSEGGDSPQYGWTLNGHTLTDSELLSGNNESNIIVLKESISGHLVCSVRNQVSVSFKQIQLSTCVHQLLHPLSVVLVDVITDEAHHRGVVSRLHDVIDGEPGDAVVQKLPVMAEKMELCVLNGTLRIMNVIRNDSGNYTMETFNSDGKSLKTHTLQLIAIAPVSSAQLVPECLSQGQMKVSCLSEGGDSPQYGWTLNGHTLTDSELLSGNNESNIIVLKQSISGHLVCSVRNQVSVSFKKIQLSTCGFIFINCSVNGTQIPRWVPKENQTLCDESFPLFIKFFMGKELHLNPQFITNTSINQI
ncbi:immunoglobulin superfamily member 10-like, partial [Cyprinodon tularosa]|uniref:immunoglobulin superfamily member 10-like n=1 Tax=Cyprinodon tularosa TaxID=77115 RepID=UPI0018E20EED